jgi:hypothetical protein
MGEGEVDPTVARHHNVTAGRLFALDIKLSYVKWPFAHGKIGSTEQPRQVR